MKLERPKFIRHYLIQLSIFFVFFSGCAQSPVNPTEGNWFLIEDITLISPERDQPIEHASVLIQDDKIVSVEAGKKISAPAGTKILEGKGKYLIPGLIDTHVHLASIPGVDLDNPPVGESVVDEYFKQLPRSYLYFGFTTLVDLAAVKPKVLADFRSTLLHPDLYDCASSLPLANGYPMAFIPKKFRFQLFNNFIYDPSQANDIPKEYFAKDHTPVASVARVKLAGGICVKTYWEKGFGKKMQFPVPSDSILKEIAASAREAGLISIVHANSLEAQEHAVGSGLDIIAHGLWNWGPLNKSEGLPPRITKLLDQVVAKKLGYMPTIQVIGGIQALADPKFLTDPNLSKVLPKGLVTYYRSSKGKWFRELIEKEEGIKLTYDSNKPPLSRVSRVTKYLADRDANLLFGTDTPSAPTYGNPPGYNGHLEMRRWIEAGVSLKKLLKAATIDNAKALKLDSTVGSIEKGKTANLLLLTKNPYESIEAFDAIDTVVLRGKSFPRSQFQAKE